MASLKVILNQFKRKEYTNMDIDHRMSLQGIQLAPFGNRAAAYIFDFFCVIILIIIASIPEALHSIKETNNYHFDVNPFHGWELISLPLYFGILTYLGHGQTPGKKLFRIRVVSLTHSHLSLWHSLERSLGYGASVLEGGFGFIQYFIHPNRQTVHDRIAETIVISVNRTTIRK